jgi:NAD(P)-dependent dehydrogenase (short-subunit alcohol dehydrogenase family)
MHGTGSNKERMIMMKTVVITGATSGIGFAVLKEMLKMDYIVLAIGHSKKNAELADTAIQNEFPDKEVRFFHGDLMQQSEVRRVASEVNRYVNENCDGKLDVLINNAGCVRSWYSTSEDGYEQQFALNHLAGFLLTHLLMPALSKANGRILITSSNSHNNTKINWNDIMFKKRYHPLAAYKQSKLCNVLFAFSLNELMSHFGIRAYAIDPGLVKTDIGLKQTGALVKMVWSLQQRRGIDASIPARTYAFVSDRNPPPEGLYYSLCNETKYSSQVTGENAERLFHYSEKLCGIHFGEV